MGYDGLLGFLIVSQWIIPIHSLRLAQVSRGVVGTWDIPNREKPVIQWDLVG